MFPGDSNKGATSKDSGKMVVVSVAAQFWDLPKSLHKNTEQADNRTKHPGTELTQN